MSLHASLSTEAQLALEKQKKKSTFYSILISILICTLLAIILSIFVMATVTKKAPEMVSYNMGIEETTTIEKPEIVNEVARKPSAPSQMTSVIASASASPSSVPTVDFSLDTASIEFGAGEDFGDGFDGDMFGSMAATGAAGGFGSSKKVLGTIAGQFYDFKQDRRGKPSNNKGDDGFINSVKKFHDAGFNARGLRDHFKADKALFVRYIAIPLSDADDAPKLFDVEKEVKPSRWMVHYSGTIKSLEAGRYRFVGSGDDYIGASIDGEPRLVAPWPRIAPRLKVEGANASSQPKHRGPYGPNFIYGSWFDLTEGQEFQLDIAIGENPGGKVGFVLLIEKEGERYRTSDNGAPILPPFSAGPLTPEDEKALKDFPNLKFDLRKVPGFQSVD
ncbi:hypothetical protein ACFPK9_11765 [Rubritalea spongiae]|uniref:PA14 domain-containing protein n=1 Tax=Rubritalea spongiae TaxID=430797 RepID=A0ABW5DZ28_9BACT